MQKIHKEDQRKRGVRRSSALPMVKTPREGPGDIRNTIMWDKGQGHIRAYRARAVLIAATISGVPRGGFWGVQTLPEIPKF
jgi:hypothetical protein